MSHIERVDHKAQAVELMLSQFENSDNILALIKSWLTPIQNMEDDLLEFMDNNGVSTATGEMLDIIGSWMGVDRQGRSDTEYRIAILGRALAEGMDGTTEKFYEGFRVLINSDLAHCFVYYPNDLYAVAGEGYGPSIQAELKRIAQAGTNVNYCVVNDLEYQVPAIRGDQDDLLYTDTGDTYQVVIDGIEYDLATNVVSSAETYGTTTTFGWQGVELLNEKSPAFKVVPFKEVQGLLVDQDGNPVVDDQGNQITVTDLEAI